MRQSPIVALYTKSYSYDDSNKNQKNEAQKMAQYESKRLVEKLKNEGKTIISIRPIHYKTSVGIEVRIIE